MELPGPQCLATGVQSSSLFHAIPCPWNGTNHSKWLLRLIWNWGISFLMWHFAENKSARFPKKSIYELCFPMVSRYQNHQQQWLHVITLIHVITYYYNYFMKSIMEFYIVCIVVMISSVMLSFIYDIIIIIHSTMIWLFPTCQVRVVGFYVPAEPQLQALDRSGPRRTRTATFGLKWSPLDPNSNLWFKGIPAVPQLQARDRSGPRRTRTATSWSKWPPPDLNCKLVIAVVPAGPEQQLLD